MNSDSEHYRQKKKCINIIIILLFIIDMYLYNLLFMQLYKLYITVFY
jgi:hypothetical protein